MDSEPMELGGDDEQWAPLSDMMAAMMLIFMFIAIVFIRSVVQAEELHDIECDKIFRSFKAEFSNDFKLWDVVLLPDLTIRFSNPDILFESGSYEMRADFQDLLSDFFPRYLHTAKEHDAANDVREIRIEGHTSSAWVGATSPADAYFKNMELSQGRAMSILRFVMELPMSVELRSWGEPLIAANGWSSSKPIRTADGVEDAARSRRVEFHLIATSCQKAGRYNKTDADNPSGNEI